MALSLGIPCGGWCPRGRWAEDGPIAARYPLAETPSTDPSERTGWNVRDADGTLILARGLPTGGTAYSIEMAVQLRKPHLVIDLEREPDAHLVRAWIREQGIDALNVAGPRESQARGVYEEAKAFLLKVLSAEC